MKPPAPVLKTLTFMAKVLPKAKLFPQKDLAALAFRDLRKRKLVCPLFTLLIWMHVYSILIWNGHGLVLQYGPTAGWIFTSILLYAQDLRKIMNMLEPFTCRKNTVYRIFMIIVAFKLRRRGNLRWKMIS